MRPSAASMKKIWVGSRVPPGANGAARTAASKCTTIYSQ